MYRVVTVKYLSEGMGRKRVVSKGPLHPDIQHANRWAQYLDALGVYSVVRVEGFDQSATYAADAMGDRLRY